MCITSVDNSTQTSGDTSRHDELSYGHGPQQYSVSTKRDRHESRESSTDRSITSNKRACHTFISSTNSLCEKCSSIPWYKIDQWMSYRGRIDWRGKLVVKVGRHYRKDPGNTTCPLCRQLHAPWIKAYLKALDPSQLSDKETYFGDRIHIFKNLRHLTHVNGFQSSMNVLRRHNAPYHIAVVPVGRGWQDNLKAHIASHGMVIVIPKGLQRSELFLPRQVSEKFDPDVVKPWLKCCEGHKTLCKAKSPWPRVPGMKLIDCYSEDLNIKDHCHLDKYVALSYVWGSPAPDKTLTFVTTGNETPQGDQCIKVKTELLQLSADSSQHISRLKPNSILEASDLNQTSAMVVQTTHSATATPDKKPLSRLPNEIPLTIQDAIKVTKDLGYQFLWVDKYCIDQNSEIDKQRQFSRMGDIYSGAQVTIFALGPGENYGLPGVSLRPRNTQQQGTTIGKYEFISTMSDPHISINKSKWSTRGWTYQEGLFSCRRLFFTDYQSYFECNAMNCVETFKSNLKILHIESGQRFRAYHRAGQFVCGNSNKFSHLNVRKNNANHRKIDTIRRCQYHIQEYTKRELTNKDDILNAFSGIASFYAKTTAKIVSLAGIPVPFPIALSVDTARAHLDHLSYALAWTHRIHKFSEPGLKNPKRRSAITRAQTPWSPSDNPEPRRRVGFPSWSWAGWFGEIVLRQDLPYCWTSHLSSVQMGFRGDAILRDYTWLTKFTYHRPVIIQKLLKADELRFDAFVLNPEKLKLWEKDPHMPSRQRPSKAIHIKLSRGPCTLETFHQRLMNGELECLVLGTYGEPREDIFKAIQAADKKAPKARKGRIGLFERFDPDAIICLIVHTVNRTSFRRGLLTIESQVSGGECALQALDLGPKRRFILN